MADDKIAPQERHLWPSAGANVQWNVLVNMQHVSDLSARTQVNIAKLTHVVPARHRTFRELLVTLRFYGALGAGLVALWWLLPKLTDPYVVGGLIAICILVFGALEIIKRLKGRD